MSGKIAVITGPTATGKTRLGIILARRLGGEIVSGDSMQLYRGMDIGTAKPTPEERAAAPHHLIDIAEPSEEWSVSRYVEAADAAVQDVLGRGRLPIVVGGTGLYIDSLVRGGEFSARSEADEICRAELESRYDEIGGEAMLRELAQVDPERAAKLVPADKKRIVRAMEVFLLTGRTISEHDLATQLAPPRYDAAYIVLDYLDRADLYERIDARVDEMVSAGLFEEVGRVFAAGVSRTAAQAIGYKEAAAALRGEISRAGAVELIKRESRRYAKRQLTWLRKKPGALWIRWGKTPDFDSAARDSTAFLAAHGII